MVVNRIYLSIFEYFVYLGQQALWKRFTFLDFKNPKFPTVGSFQTYQFHGIGPVISPVLVYSPGHPFLCLFIRLFVCMFVCPLVKNWLVSYF